MIYKSPWKSFVRALIFAFVVLGVGQLRAQEEPAMVFLTSHTAIGSSGAAATIMKEKLEEFFGGSVEYRYSQGQFVGRGVEADGKTMIMSINGTMTLMPALVEDFEMNPFTDLRPITRATITPDPLLIRSSLGIETIEELVEYAAASDAPLTYSHIAPQSVHRVEMDSIFHEFGINNVVLNESIGMGARAALDGLESGDLDMVALTSPYAVPYIERGVANALVVVSPNRIAAAPDAPTLSEFGIPDMEYGSWAGIYVPAGTSDEDATRVYEAVKYALSDPKTVAKINALGLEVGLNASPDEFVEFLHDERARLRKVVEKYQISID